MSTAALPAFVTEEEYLTNPEYKHCEYVDGQAVPTWLILDEDGSLPDSEGAQSVGTARHSAIQFRLSYYMGLTCRITQLDGVRLSCIACSPFVETDITGFPMLRSF